MGLKAATAKELALDLAYDIIGSIFYAMGVYTFAKMGNFAPGGLTGLALIANHLWALPIGLTTLLLNIPLMLLSFRILGRRFELKSIKTMCVCTVFLDIVFPRLPAYTGVQFMAALYSGIFLGIGSALFYMRGSSSGGADFLTMSVKALRPHLSIGMVTMAIDLVVILMGWPVFGNADAVLYGLTAMLLTSVVIDKIMYGIGAGALLIIITGRGEEIARHINEMIGRGATELRARGSYTGETRDVLLCACSKSQAYLVRRAAQELDEAAFVMVTETSEVFGEGFSERPPAQPVKPARADKEARR